MDLSLSKEIKNAKKDNMEITEFINELSASLENRKEINANSNLYIEIIEDVELTNDEIQKYKDYGITFYEPIDNNGGIVESDSLKDWMKCEVDIELLDIKNKT